MNEIYFNRLTDAAVARDLDAAVRTSEHSRHARLWREAHRLYTRAYAQGQAHRLLAFINGHRRSLYDLNQIFSRALPQHYSGIQTVPVARIQGSEGRPHGFDRDFRPLEMHGQHRWLCVAAAVLEGQPMPPISLIRVGDIYFVRDGHHRVSVARAWGQVYIDAEVVVWEAPHPLPWEAPGHARTLTHALRESEPIPSP